MDGESVGWLNGGRQPHTNKLLHNMVYVGHLRRHPWRKSMHQGGPGRRHRVGTDTEGRSADTVSR
jgi:hypothetical protein